MLLIIIMHNKKNTVKTVHRPVRFQDVTSKIKFNSFSTFPSLSSPLKGLPSRIFLVHVPPPLQYLHIRRLGLSTCDLESLAHQNTLSLSPSLSPQGKNIIIERHPAKATNRRRYKKNYHQRTKPTRPSRKNFRHKCCV